MAKRPVPLCDFAAFVASDKRSEDGQKREPQESKRRNEHFPALPCEHWEQRVTAEPANITLLPCRCAAKRLVSFFIRIIYK